jgi:glutaredoxin
LAKEFLSKKGVPFKDFDVIADKAALEEMRQVSGGALRVPVISVCNEVMVGFDRDRLELALSCLKQSTKLEDAK